MAMPSRLFNSSGTLLRIATSQRLMNIEATEPTWELSPGAMVLAVSCANSGGTSSDTHPSIMNGSFDSIFGTSRATRRWYSSDFRLRPF